MYNQVILSVTQPATHCLSYHHMKCQPSKYYAFVKIAICLAYQDKPLVPWPSSVQNCWIMDGQANLWDMSTYACRACNISSCCNNALIWLSLDLFGLAIIKFSTYYLLSIICSFDSLKSQNTLKRLLGIVHPGGYHPGARRLLEMHDTLHPLPSQKRPGCEDVCSGLNLTGSRADSSCALQIRVSGHAAAHLPHELSRKAQRKQKGRSLSFAVGRPLYQPPKPLRNAPSVSSPVLWAP